MKFHADKNLKEQVPPKINRIAWMAPSRQVQVFNEAGTREKIKKTGNLEVWDGSGFFER